ncbi:MAG: hypothetical protein O3A51_11035 [Verrucomicrobia bacterium]|nr:hypothetical protein [Verrucomicrobiota bacterium]
MIRWVQMIMIAALVAPAMAQSDAPIVRIPGRTDRAQRMQYVTPQADQGSAPAQATEPYPVVADKPTSDPRLPPVGSVQAWLKSTTNTPPLTANWVECNGQMIEDPHSPYKGQRIPNLNGLDGVTPVFLQGAEVSGKTGGSVNHTHGAYRSQKYGSQRLPVMANTPADHLPPYYSVVWIMRIK